MTVLSDFMFWVAEDETKCAGRAEALPAHLRLSKPVLNLQSAKTLRRHG
jgi:hypothetical protein